MRIKIIISIIATIGFMIEGCVGKQSSKIIAKDSAKIQSSPSNKEIVNDPDIPESNNLRIKMDADDLFVGETERNYPDFRPCGRPNIDFKIVRCRVRKPSPITFPKYYNTDFNNLTDPTLIIINELRKNDLIHLYELISDTKEKKYYNLLIKLVQSDTTLTDNEVRINLIKCIAFYNNDTSKTILIKLLQSKNQTIATVSAICLVKMNIFGEALDYFTNKFNRFDDYAEYVEYIYSSLMYINTSESIALLKTLSKVQNNPGYALDALAAISLLGNCDFAFNGFKSFLTDNSEAIREKTVSCLAYYIGSDQAFELIKSLEYDGSLRVQNEVKHVLRLYNQNQH